MLVYGVCLVQLKNLEASAVILKVKPANTHLLRQLMVVSQSGGVGMPHPEPAYQSKKDQLRGKVHCKREERDVGEKI
jgi:hypothetical protein